MSIFIRPRYKRIGRTGDKRVRPGQSSPISQIQSYQLILSNCLKRFWHKGPASKVHVFDTYNMQKTSV